MHSIKYMAVKHVSNVNITCGDSVLFTHTKTFRVAHHLVYVLINVFVYQQKLLGWLGVAIHSLFLSRIIRTLCSSVCICVCGLENEWVREEGERRSEISPLENFIIVYKQSTPNLSLNANSVQYISVW